MGRRGGWRRRRGRSRPGRRARRAPWRRCRAAGCHDRLRPPVVVSAVAATLGAGDREVRPRRLDWRRHDLVRREDGRRRRGAGGGVHEGKIGPAARLDPRGRGPGGEAGRQHGAPLHTGAVARERCQQAIRAAPRCPLGGPAVASASSWRQRELVEAGRLGQPVDGVEGLDCLAGGALDEVVDHPDRQDSARPLVGATWTRQLLLPRTCFVEGGWVTTWTKASPA